MPKEILYGVAYRDYDSDGEARVLFRDPGVAKRHVDELNEYDEANEWKGGT